jgi:hypothetical protein
MIDAGHFKFLNREHAFFLIESPMQLRFGRLAFYRLLEKLTNDRNIGDAGEGELIVECVGNHRAPDPTDVVILHSTRLVYQADCFVFSAVEGDFDPAARSLLQSGPNAYDTALRILDIQQLVTLIASSTINGQSVDDNFEISSGPVRYAAKDVLQLTANTEINGGDPYLKDTLYQRQQEYRIVLTPRAPYPACDFVVVKMPDGPSLFEAIDGIPHTRDFAAMPFLSGSDAARVITELLSDWRTAWSDSPNRIAEHYTRLRNPNRQFRYKEIVFEPFLDRLGQVYWQVRERWQGPIMDKIFLNASPSTDEVVGNFERYASLLGRLEANPCTCNRPKRA